MKRSLLVLTILFLFIVTLGQIEDSSKNTHSTSDSQIQTQVSFNFPETVQIKDISDKPGNNSFVDKSMPWIAALIIGILSAFVNFWIASNLRKSSEVNLQRQIENAKEITLIQFKATIATKNRQEWINDLRHNLSELISNSTSMKIETFKDKVDHENIRKIAEKIFYCVSKIKMLINEDKKEQKDLITKIDELVSDILNIDESSDDRVDNAIEKVIVSARVIFDLHWKKIKNLN